MQSIDGLPTPVARALGELRGWLLVPGRVEGLAPARQDLDADTERAFLASLLDQLSAPEDAAAWPATVAYLSRAMRCYHAARKAERDPETFAWLLDDLIDAIGWACEAQDAAWGRISLDELASAQRLDRASGTFGMFLSDAQGGSIGDAWHPRLVGPGRQAIAFQWHRWAKAVCERDYLSRAAKQLAPLLAMYADGQGVCWPSQKQLARLSGMSVRAVRDAVRELERDLALYVERPATGRASAQYRLLSTELDPLAASVASRT